MMRVPAAAAAMTVNRRPFTSASREFDDKCRRRSRKRLKSFLRNIRTPEITFFVDLDPDFRHSVSCYASVLRAFTTHGTTFQLHKVIINMTIKCKMEDLGDTKPMETIGSKGLVKKSEFIRILIDALFSLGFADIAARLENESKTPLHSSTAKKFLELVKHGEWDKSIDALQGFELRDEEAVRFLLLEQKFFEFLKTENVAGALRTLRDEMEPLGVNKKRIHELASEVISASVEDAESVRLVEKLQSLFPPAVIVPERKLEYFLENHIDLERKYFFHHNVVDSDLSLFSKHECGKRKISSETVVLYRYWRDIAMKSGS